jgi:hypothetical protein
MSDQQGSGCFIASPELAELAKNISKEFAKLRKELGGFKTINRFQTIDFVSLEDELNNIQEELVSQIDGRPPALKFEKFNEDLRAKNVEPWAESRAKGDRIKGIIGGREFTIQEVDQLRSWLDVLMTWHLQA